MNLTKVLSIASLCAMVAVSAAAQATGSTTPSTTTPPASSSMSMKPKTTTAKATTPTNKIAAADLPPAVTSAVMAKYPKATIASATKMTKGTTVTYSVAYKATATSKTTSHVTVGEDGKIVAPASSKTKTTAAPAATK